MPLWAISGRQWLESAERGAWRLSGMTKPRSSTGTPWPPKVASAPGVYGPAARGQGPYATFLLFDCHNDFPEKRSPKREEARQRHPKSPFRKVRFLPLLL